VKKFIVLLTAVLFIFLSVSTLQSQAVPAKKIKNIRVETGENQVNVFVDMDTITAYESFILISPNRLVLDFQQVTEISLETPVDVNAYGIKSIRTGKSGQGGYRLVIDFENEIPEYAIKEVETGLEISFRAPAKTKVSGEAKIQKAEQVPVSKQEEVKAKLKEAASYIETGRKKNMFGIFSGFYFMQDSAFQSIYGKSSPIIGAEYAFTLPLESVHSLDVWFGFSTLSKKGKTTYFAEDITLSITNFSLALRYIGQFGRFAPFAGGGIDYFVYKESYPETYPVSSVGGSDLGFHLQAGTYIDIISGLAAKLHIKYNFSKTESYGSTINLGGIQYGIGLAFRFNL